MVICHRLKNPASIPRDDASIQTQEKKNPYVVKAVRRVATN